MQSTKVLEEKISRPTNRRETGDAGRSDARRSAIAPPDASGTEQRTRETKATNHKSLLEQMAAVDDEMITIVGSTSWS